MIVVVFFFVFFAASLKGIHKWCNHITTFSRALSADVMDLKNVYIYIYYFLD